MAPFMPFVSEYVYQHLVRGIHRGGEPVGVVCHVKVHSDQVPDVSSLEAWQKSFLKDGMNDSASSMKVYRREVLQDLPVFHGIHRFLPAISEARGFRVMEVPVHHRPRRTSRYWLRSHPQSASSPGIGLQTPGNQLPPWSVRTTRRTLPRPEC